MKHELFKTFVVHYQNSNSEEVVSFLESGTILPRSISLCYIGDLKNMLVIGYENTEQTSDKYGIEVRETGSMLFHGLDSVGPTLEEFVQELGGVICHDLEFSAGKIKATFLTTK